MIDDSHSQAEDEQERSLSAGQECSSPMTGEKSRASLLPPDIGRKWRNRVRH